MNAKTHLSGLMVGLGFVALPFLARAQGFYLDANAGVALADEMDVKRFLVPTPGAKFEFDPGMRLSVAGGYNFNEYIGLQAETGLIYNEVDDVNGGGSIDASLGHVPMIASVVVRYDKPDCRFIPFAGIGAGGDVSVLTVDNVRAPNGTLVDGDASDLVFAWQAFAGARYRLNDRMSIGGAYKFFSAEGASWDVEDTSGDIEGGRADVHSFVVDFNIRF